MGVDVRTGVWVAVLVIVGMGVLVIMAMLVLVLVGSQLAFGPHRRPAVPP